MKAKKFFGQHFLKDESVVTNIINAAGVEGANVLEIGPGSGVLTRHLVKRAKKVVSVDIDREAIEATRAKVKSPKLSLIERDILDVSQEEIGSWFDWEPYILVGNIPYNITSDLLNKFLTQPPTPARSVWMVQKEVAKRMVAGAGDMSRLGLLVQLYSEAELICDVPRGAFAPPPKVDSAVVRLKHFSVAHMRERGIDDPEAILRFADIAFQQKRRQMQKTLTTLPCVMPDMLTAALKQLHHSTTARPEELSSVDWIALFGFFQR
ncbi:ribosomal RNA small subunit methyltransferase A [Candidatus Uhrbacteria bacterium]|nr:ribosomal RNA small subunit methyltransferase A [Candidatus Uhrbacteria bacterium]